MLLLLLLAAGGGDSGGNLDIPVDPVRAWFVIASMFAVPVGAVLVSVISRKKTTAAEPAAPSVVINGSVTPQVDATQALLATVVGKLQAECDELKRLQVQSVRAIARFEMKVEQLENRVLELETENNILRTRR